MIIGKKRERYSTEWKEKAVFPQKVKNGGEEIREKGRKSCEEDGQFVKNGGQ